MRDPHFEGLSHHSVDRDRRCLYGGFDSVPDIEYQKWMHPSRAINGCIHHDGSNVRPFQFRDMDHMSHSVDRDRRCLTCGFFTQYHHPSECEFVPFTPVRPFHSRDMETMMRPYLGRLLPFLNAHPIQFLPLYPTKVGSTSRVSQPPLGRSAPSLPARSLRCNTTVHQDRSKIRPFQSSDMEKNVLSFHTSSV